MTFIDRTAPPLTQTESYTSKVLENTLCISGIVGLAVGGSLVGANLLDFGSALGISLGLPMGSTLIAYAVIKVREHLKTLEKPELSETGNSSLSVEVKKVIYRNDSEGNRFITEEQL